MDERFPTMTDLCCSRTVDAMDQFRQADGRERRFLIACVFRMLSISCSTVSPRRSAAMTTEESRISPMLAD